ncbi:AsmA family protein [Duganella sp. LX20W]|uniref:AsmA family protein n=1 Tax=Rugamonas brunnea TaxID=2758569 RepID=A0A7W2IAE9_9BURK|nr:AsmA family protein [Rugamonas brunnea]MBA5636045.1 AsmA family protein [Rugamonas brunnea]
MSSSRPVSRPVRLVLWVAAVAIALPALAVAVLLNVDWNRARPWLSARVGDALGRPFAIRGDLRLTWERQGHTAADTTWRDYLPLPHLVADDVHLGNPPGMAAMADKAGPAAATDDMASVRQFSFTLDLLPLLEHRIVIPVLRFDTPAVLLRRDAQGHDNWTFKPAEQPSPWRLQLHQVVFSKGTVHYVDALTRADATAEVDTLAGDPLYGVAWRLRGQWNGQPVQGSGKAGAVLSLQQQLAPYPLTARLTVGATDISVTGTLTKPTELAALDVQLQVAGASMARLYGLTGVLLPETPAFRTAGHLRASLGPHASDWHYDRFTGKVGASDIAGDLAFRTGGARPRLTGAVHSTLLQFSDLAPLIGADSNASKRARGVAPVQPGDKVLPVESFKTERWTSIDADVRFQAQRIVRERELPIHRLDTALRLQDGVLTLAPLNFDVAGGKLSSDIRLDGSGKRTPHALQGTLKASARHVQLKQLFPALPAKETSVGELNGEATLSATGNSVASLLASSNGELRTVINQGSVSKLLLEEMGLNIGNVVLAKLFGDKQVKLNCMLTDFSVSDGLMHTRQFIVDTDDATLNVNGTVSLAQEKLDLTLKPDSKGLRVFSLRAPIYVRGTFKRPDVSLDKGVLALRAGGALALAAVAPVAAILPLVNAGPGGTAVSGCAPLLAPQRK